MEPMLRYFFAGGAAGGGGGAASFFFAAPSDRKRCIAAWMPLSSLHFIMPLVMSDCFFCSLSLVACGMSLPLAIIGLSHASFLSRSELIAVAILGQASWFFITAS